VTAEEEKVLKDIKLDSPEGAQYLADDYYAVTFRKLHE
jgi:hypothetical protein